MSCYFCGGSRIASIHSAPDRGVCNWSVGSMTLTRRYDGEPIVRVELDTSVSLDVSVNGLCGDTVSADVTADAYIEDKKMDKVDDEEVLEYCHSLAVSMTTLETVAMVGRLVPWFLVDKGCEDE